MAQARYKCPHCGKYTGIRMVYSNCKVNHKCTKCGGKNIVSVRGYEIWRPSGGSAVKEVNND